VAALGQVARIKDGQERRAVRKEHTSGVASATGPRRPRHAGGTGTGKGTGIRRCVGARARQGPSIHAGARVGPCCSPAGRVGAVATCRAGTHRVQRAYVNVSQ